MNKTLITLLVAMGTATAANADELWSLGFDTYSAGNDVANGYALTQSGGNSIAEFASSNGFFGHSSNSSNWNSRYSYNNVEGGFFGGADIDAGGSLPVYLTTLNIDISGATDLQFAVDLAEDDDGSNQDWDAADFVDFEYSVDGGAWFNIFSALYDDDATGNFNEIAEVNGVEITDSFATFSAALSGVTGTNLQLRVAWSLDSKDEDLAIDNLTINGTRMAVVPLPSAAWAGLGLLGAMGVGRRLRK